MLLTDRLKGVGAEVAAIRSSLSPVRRTSEGGYDVADGISSRDRMIRLRSREGQRQVRALAALIADVHTGRRPDWHLREAMGVGDFPNLFGDLLYRQLLGNYMPWPVTYPKWCRIVDVKDFRSLHLYAIDGGVSLPSTLKAESIVIADKNARELLRRKRAA